MSKVESVMVIAFCAMILAGCGDDPIPRPKGWLRLDLPEKAYQPWSPDCPFSAELPVYCEARPHPAGAPCWFDLRFPGQRATVHLTYQSVNGRLPELIGNALEFKSKHEAKAVKISREQVLRDSDRVFGTLFDVEGDVASPLVFYLTDSTTHFLYGALYFDTRPNGDSLAPVTARIREDMRNMAASLAWK